MNKWLKIGIIAVGAVLLVCIVVTAALTIFSSSKKPAPPDLAKSIAQMTSLKADLITPNEGDQWPINSFIPVRGVAKSDTRVVALELWIDGNLFAARDGLDKMKYSTATGEWFWQPAVKGPHSLFLRGVDDKGGTAYSQIIQITAVDQVGSRQLITPEAGQTLAQIAADKGISIEEAGVNNPGIDPEQPLTPEQDIFIPLPPEPVKDVELQTKDPYLPTPEDSAKKPNDWIVNLPLIGGLFKDTGAGEESSLPNAPTLITAELRNGCDVYLEFKDNSKIEDGQRIFRAIPGQTSFAKVADLPPLITKSITFTDPAIHIKGKWMYYAVSYNTAGEAKSSPVSIDLQDPACLPEEPAPQTGGTGGLGTTRRTGTMTDDFIIVRSEPVSLAYVYFTINGQTTRIPASSSDFFLKGNDYEFDLSDYMLKSINSLPAATEYIINVQLWGWNSGKPELIEEYNKVISDYTRLLACLETSSGFCDSPEGVWSDHVIIPWFVPLENVNLHFKMFTLKKATGAYWVMSSATLFGEEYRRAQYDNAGSPPTGGNVPGYFSDSWSALYNTSDTSPDDEFNWEKDYLPWTKSGFWRYHTMDRPFMVYYEVLPNYRNPDTDNMEYPMISNRVYVYNEMGAPKPEPEKALAPHFPDIYSVEFLEDTYKLPQFAIPERWGCIKYLDNGQEACPTPYVDPCEDSMSWDCFKATGSAALTQFIDAYDWFAAHYNEVVGVVSNALIDFIPGCRGTSACEWISTQVVKLAWTVITSELGLPAQLPQTGELADAGAEYVVEYYVGSAYDDIMAGVDINELLEETGADDYAKSVVGSFLSEKAEEYKKKLVGDLTNQFLNSLKTQTPAACMDVDAAHRQGIEPLCPDPNRPWKPAPGAKFVGPTIDVKVTRKPVEENSNFGTDASTLQHSDADKYSLKLTNNTVNEYRVGQVIPLLGYSEAFNKDYAAISGCPAQSHGVPICYFGPGGQISLPYWFEVTQPLEAPLYKDVEMPIPWLDIGKSITIPIYFPEKTFWAPGKAYQISELIDPEKWKELYGDDWKYLYFYGNQSFKAESTCKSNLPENVFCGASDTFVPTVADPNIMQNVTEVTE